MAWRTAVATRCGISRGSCACPAHFTNGLAACTCGASWKSPRSISSVLDEPAMSSIGQQFASALPRAVIAFVMPGPETTAAAPMRPFM